MLIRLILLLATLLQAAGISTGAAHAHFQHPTFAAAVCKGDAIPAAPYSPIDHNGSCSDCIACCDSCPPVLCALDDISHLIRSTTQTVVFASATLVAPPKHAETPPTRASPA
ncbi:MAG: hypothetical protein HYS63_00460 [Methylocystis sp.]|nr:hypothetical protein [Methylocystis sp.]